MLVVLALFELWTSVSLSLFYQRELGPAVTIPQRAGMVALQQRSAARSSAARHPASSTCPGYPATAPTLDLAVVGHCAGVYQFDGNTWQPVELGAEGAPGGSR